MPLSNSILVPSSDGDASDAISAERTDETTILDLGRPAEKSQSLVDDIRQRSQSAGAPDLQSTALTPQVCHGDIAIVGIGCQFAQSPDVREYWQNIVRGFNSIRQVPDDRWDAELYYSADRQAPDKLNSKWGSFLDDVVFDPLRYHMPPNTLKSIEPIQLLALEAARHALEDAGYPAPAANDSVSGTPARTAVIFAVAPVHDRAMDYAFRTMCPHYLSKIEWLSVDERQRILNEIYSHLPEWTEDSFPGYLPNVVAGRITNRLDLGGTNLVVDAACAASLAALHVGIKELSTHAADAVVVGAADGTNNPFGFMSFAKTFALTSSGQPKPFDDHADGIALGEGVAAVVIKRLADAERDGDQIYAVIKGIGSSSDGRSRSLTAPCPEGQISALERAYADAQVDPRTITLVEGHGTGTAVGDRTEITSLQTLLSAKGNARQSCALGSVKSMIGHTKIVAGMAGLIKTAMALKHRVLPPTINVTAPNNAIDFATSPLYLNTEPRPWISAGPEIPRRAGLSAFGFGGTNFHVVMEEYTGRQSSQRPLNVSPRDAELFVWRRRESLEIVRSLELLRNCLDETPTVKLAALAAAVACDEAEVPAADQSGCRLAIVATSIDDLRAKLQLAGDHVPSGSIYTNPTGIYFSPAAALDPAAVCFLFPGQGSQSINALRDLAVGSPDLLPIFERANEALRGKLVQDLSQYLYPVPTFDADEAQQFQERLNDTRVAQPALGALDLFAARLLGEFGVVPGAVAGHSYGELVALCVAGAISERDLIQLSAERGRAAEECSRSCPGRMAAVAADAQTTTRRIDELKLPVRLANLNSPRQTIIAGEEAAIDLAVAELGRSGLRAKKIAVTAAFHTPAVAPAAEVLEKCLSGIEFQPPTIPVWSNTTAEPYPTEAAAARGLLVRHLVNPVLFDQQIRAMHAAGARLFVEVGPGSVLTGLVGQILHESPHTAIALDAGGRRGWTQLAHLLGQCVALGLPVQTSQWFSARQLSHVGVTQLCETERLKQQRKPTDWLINGGQARPCFPIEPAKPVVKTATPLPETKATLSNEPMLKSTAMSQSPANAVPRRPQPKPSHLVKTYQTTGVSEMIDVSHSQDSELTTELSTSFGSASQNSAGLHALLSFQHSMSQWMELQGQQLAVTQQFLQTQERLVMSMLEGGGPTTGSLPALAAPTPMRSIAAPAPAAVSRPARVLPAPTRRGTQPPARGEAPPAPVASERMPAAASAPAPAAPKPAAAAPPAPAPSKNGHAVEKPSAAPAGGPPPTEEFRACLLNTVMQRTGYPVEMLDEDLPLESGLGIDSIKTLEIFNALTDYHPYFKDEDDQDQEDVLADFAQLRTLGQIIGAYDTKRARFLPSANGAAAAVVAKTPSNSEPEPDSQAVGQRYAVTAVSTPLESDGGEKKNGSHRSTSY